MATTALIIGITGQDGAYLAEHLLGRGYHVVGGARRTSGPRTERLDELGITRDIELVNVDVVDDTSIRRALVATSPAEVYNLAAQSHVGDSFEQAAATGDVTGLGAVRVLDAVRDVAPDARLYQASSSEMYGSTGGVLDERSSFAPRSPYAAAKAYAHWMARNHREAYGMHVSCGILFNHESPLRGEQFVTRKLTRAAARISVGMQQDVRIGNLAARRDWGYAREYVDAMHRMLQQDEPGDFVVATGISHSVRDLAEAAFAAVDLDWNEHVVVDDDLLRPLDVEALVGDSSRAQEQLGWSHETTFGQLVELMVHADVERSERERSLGGVAG